MRQTNKLRIASENALLCRALSSLNQRKRVFFFIIACFSSFLVLAQEENSLLSNGGGRTGAGTALFRDYQCVGVNPANLGIFQGENVQVTMGFLAVSGLFYSDALPKSDLISSLLKGKKLSTGEKNSIARDFLESGNSFTGELMPFGIAIEVPKVGGIGFSWRERMTGDVKFTKPLADIIFNGTNSPYIDTLLINLFVLGNVGDLFNGSSLQYNWLREYNLSYGRKIIGNDLVSWYLGGGVKFLQSNAITDISFNADTISGFGAFSKLFKIDYGDFTDPAAELKGKLTPVGKGWGFDIGTTISFMNKIFGAVSVTDIGSVKYQGNLVTITDAFKDSLFNFIGINEANIFTSLDDLFNAAGLFQYLPQGERTVKLPSQFHIGAGWKATKRIELAVDMIQPLNNVPGNLPKAEYAALVNYSPVEAIRLSGGFVGGGFANFDVPVGISFSFLPKQVWQLSIGTGDIVSWVKQDKPSISLNLSLLRFHFE